MAYAYFHEELPKAAKATQTAGNALRAVRDSTGDMPLGLLDRSTRALLESKVVAINAITEGSKNTTKADALMADITAGAAGAPTTLAEFQQALTDATDLATAWHQLWAAAIPQIPASYLIEVVQEDYKGLVGLFIRRRDLMPAAQADALRGSDELAALIAAIEAVGG